MNIENDIFKKCVILYDKLIPYGFKKIDKKYIISKNILDDTFKVVIEISNNVVNGKIYDLAFNEEYTNYRVKNQTGEFVSKVRSEFLDILMDIKDKCTITNYFITNQANRLTNLIIKRYNDIPEFAWDKSPGFGIFRNPSNKKWYALIMNIDKNKIDNKAKSEEVEILNLKLSETKINKLLGKKGFYKAYHMNKKNWITIILDDTVSDDEIMNYIDESHNFTQQTKEWIIPANPKYYDVINCFNDTDTITWKQSNNIRVGDLVYLYIANPYSSILYKCKVLETDIPYKYKDKNLAIKKVMKIKLLKRFDKDKYTFDKLKRYGVNAIRSARFMPKSLSEEINK